MTRDAMVLYEWDEVLLMMKQGRKFRRFAWKAEGFLCFADVHVPGREQPVATVLWRANSDYTTGYQYLPVERDKRTTDWFEVK